LLETAINGSPTSAIKRYTVDQYRSVVGWMDDVEQVESIATRVALGRFASESRCREARNAPGMSEQ
jgi:hypothetical protein